MHYTMGMTPAWAAPDAPRSPYGIGSKAAPPDDLKHWDRYVRAVASRYRGRIGAYELWDYPNIPFRFTRDTATLVQMTNRAADIIEDVDPEATVVCPSIGELWSAAGRRYMAEFARLGGYGRCEAIAIKFHPRSNWGRPEEMTELAVHIDRTLHSVGVNLPIWATGPGHSISEEPKLGEDDANNYAVRYYLAGLYSRHYERMYFYSWGVGNIPLVLQVVKSRPTRAALFVERLQDWLDGASIRSCGLGEPDGLPDGVWQCRFQLPGPSGRPAEGAIRWTAQGAAVMSLEHDAYRIDHLDGRTVPVRGGQALRVTERPVLIRFRAERGPAAGR